VRKEKGAHSSLSYPLNRNSAQPVNFMQVMDVYE